MLKYRCDNCGQRFLVPAKILKNEPTEDGTFEYSVCPFCKTPRFDEYTPEITSVKSVDLADVDGYLQNGYQVKELYSKNAVLIKLA